MAEVENFIDLSGQLAYLLQNRIGPRDPGRPINGAMVSRVVGVDQSTVSDWRNGRRLTPSKYLPALAAAFGKTVEDFLNGPTGEPTTPIEGPSWGKSTLGVDRIEPPKYEAYCLMCGRGEGPGGVLYERKTLPPHWRELRCAHCGGRMMAREVDSAELSRVRSKVAA